MPYCQALVMEALRFFMRYTCGIAHRALTDTKLCGFDIPKDTMIVASFAQNMTDARYIKNPLNFDPTNFLDEDGKLTMPTNHFPFALAKHKCIGEMLAKSNLFMLCTTILQNFYLEVPPGHGIPSDVPVDGATPNVQDYEALIILRN